VDGIQVHQERVTWSMPKYFERLCSAIDQLPSACELDVTPHRSPVFLRNGEAVASLNRKLTRSPPRPNYSRLPQMPPESGFGRAWPEAD
jgi:hypothetical protein